jgi:hypothetical protein
MALAGAQTLVRRAAHKVAKRALERQASYTGWQVNGRTLVPSLGMLLRFMVGELGLARAPAIWLRLLWPLCLLAPPSCCFSSIPGSLHHSHASARCCPTLAQAPFVLWMAALLVIYGISYDKLSGLEGPLVSLSMAQRVG